MRGCGKAATTGNLLEYFHLFLFFFLFLFILFIVLSKKKEKYLFQISIFNKIQKYSFQFFFDLSNDYYDFIQIIIIINNGIIPVIFRLTATSGRYAITRAHKISFFNICQNKIFARYLAVFHIHSHTIFFHIPHNF